ncbi:MAG: TetR/AcrR family transcriptional regulator [Nitriliruptoraceae bacterium]|nr:TetR/AcrR family transcriptional regulator [Nitriliruptoraceae bacterium]
MSAPRLRQKARHPRRMPRQDRAHATVAFVLEAAAQVFAERGYAATTNEIAARAGVSIGSLYQYFADKDALLVALAERHLAEAMAQLQAVLADAPTDRELLIERVIEAVVDLNRPSALHTVLYQAAPRTPELVAVLDRLRDDLAATVAALLVLDGVEPQVAQRRGHALVVAVDAAVHEHVLAAHDPDDERARIADVVTLTSATLAAYTR